MIFGIALVVLVVASVLFHYLSPWYLTPLASNWSTIDTTIDITFWVTGFVFVAINLFMAYVVIRYRYDKNRRAEYQPENKKLEGWLTVLTSVGVAAMLAPGLWVWAEFVNVPDDATKVEAIGQQWHWSYRFPGADGKLGSVESQFVNDTNPFGMDPDDPAGQDDILVASPIVHLPVNEPVQMLLRSKDVLHNFTVAQFRVKMDLVPGLVSHFWLTPTRTGEFEVLCEELCGVGHFAMRGLVVVDERPAFDTWIAAQPTYAELRNRKGGNAVAGQALYAVCTTCHGPQGEGNPVLNAPKIAGQDAWYLRRQLEHFKTGVRGANPKDLYGQQMAAMAATLADATAIEDVIAHVQTFPDSAAAPTVVGDVHRGADIYTTCRACHGADAQGIQATNAPRQAGMSDWYLVTQLKNFREGIRGRHPQDLYGTQMAMMAQMLNDDAAINDVVAYVNTLESRQSLNVSMRMEN